MVDMSDGGLLFSNRPLRWQLPSGDKPILCNLQLQVLWDLSRVGTLIWVHYQHIIVTSLKPYQKDTKLISYPYLYNNMIKSAKTWEISSSSHPVVSGYDVIINFMYILYHDVYVYRINFFDCSISLKDGKPDFK